jgi:hypothetical protein
MEAKQVNERAERSIGSASCPPFVLTNVYYVISIPNRLFPLSVSLPLDPNHRYCSPIGTGNYRDSCAPNSLIKNPALIDLAPLALSFK